MRLETCRKTNGLGFVIRFVEEEEGDNDLLTLGDELGGVELGDDGLEDFVSDGGEDTLIVVLTERLWKRWDIRLEIYCYQQWEDRSYLVDLRESLDFRPVQDSECQADHLEIL